MVSREDRITNVRAATLAALRCKLLVAAKTVGYGGADIDGAHNNPEELILRLLADAERLAGA